MVASLEKKIMVLTGKLNTTNNKGGDSNSD
jgi:hypothetical protein